MRKYCFLCFLLLWGILPLLSQPKKSAAPLATHRSSLITHHSTRAVVIGISDYQDPEIPDLRFAHRDAEAFANFLRSPAGGSLDNDHLKVLTNEQATAGRIAGALDALVEQAKEGDQVIIYFSGHGDVERNIFSQPGFLLCWDAPSRVYMGGGTYSLAYLEAVVTTLSVQNKARVTVITDACHAGKLSGSQIGGAQLTSANLAKQYANEIKILSCQPNEFSLEGEQWGGGRGCFSYHLVDGLFGLADRNEDDLVTAGELDRYLEDHVTAEAAPQSQVPMLLGNKTERLARVNAQLLADLQKYKSGQMPVFAPVEERGFEDEVLARVDSGIREQYFAFKRAIEEKRFFPAPAQSGAPENDCADVYYTRLSQNTALEPLWGIMKRNYAAALQDDAQQAVNTWMKASPIELEQLRKTLKIEPIPKQLSRAADLLGEQHYLYKSLKARQYLFEGKVLQESTARRNPDKKIGQRCISLFQKSLEYAPDFPVTYLEIMSVYNYNYQNLDSAVHYFNVVRSIAPNWVLPLVNFYWSDNIVGIDEKDNIAIQSASIQTKDLVFQALAIDSSNLSVLAMWSDWLMKENRYEEAKSAIEKALAISTIYIPSLDNILATLYTKSGQLEKGISTLQKSIAQDSTYVDSWANISFMLNQAGRFDEAEKAASNAIRMDSTLITAWNNLATAYNRKGAFANAETAYLKAIQLDTSFFAAIYSLGHMYKNIGKHELAIPYLEKAFKLNPIYLSGKLYLAAAYIDIRQFEKGATLLEEVLRVDSFNLFALGHMSLLNIRQGKTAEAKTWIDRLLIASPDHPRAILCMAYLLHSEGKTAESISYVEQAIGKGRTFGQLEQDEDLAPLRALPEWKDLMKKYFPDKVKD